MKILLLFIVMAFITCAATNSQNESSGSIEEEQEENTSSSNERPISSSVEDDVNDSSSSSSSSSSIESSSQEEEDCKVNYRYTIWIGDHVDEVHSIKLESKCGTIFLQAMQQAFDKKRQFAFEHTTTHPMFGTFVTQINGVENDDEANSYWMLYDLKTEPDVDDVPDDRYLCSVGVSSMEVLDGHSYLFWYRSVIADASEDY